MRFTDEQLERLDRPELENLRTNALRLAVEGRVDKQVANDVVVRIDARLKLIRPKRAGGKKSVGTSLERRVAEALGKVAVELNGRYDLSRETARKLSVGTKHFQPHSLTDPKGDGKTGGSMKGGRMQIDRYISYRVRDSVACVAYLLFPGESEDQGRYLVLVTDDMTQEGVPLNDFVPPDNEYGWSPGFRDRMRVLPFPDLEAAAECYEALIARLAPART